VKHELRIDVSHAVGSLERLEVAATVVTPTEPLEFNGIVMFGYPGGGYSRRYYDVDSTTGADQLSGYSQALFHASQGAVFVACDHLGVGDSDIPSQPIDFTSVAKANAAASAAILDTLRAGTYARGAAQLDISSAVAMGQSFGGFLLTIAQADNPVFDGVAFLGWSGIQTISPYPSGVQSEKLKASHEDGSVAANPRAKSFHYQDVEPTIVAADLTRDAGRAGSNAPWGSVHRPGGPCLQDRRSPLDPGVVANDAARITTPVFVASGEIDVIADPRREAAAYSASTDITITTFERMAHMHNFASTRERLWRRLDEWARTVDAVHR
jgi:pimeloyl-ACP methyl ester carboxylesterase